MPFLAVLLFAVPFGPVAPGVERFTDCKAVAGLAVGAGAQNLLFPIWVESAAAFGAWFGWQALVPIILMASVIGAVVGIGIKLVGRLREGGYVPFGPFLALGGLTAMVFGPQAILAAVGL